MMLYDTKAIHTLELYSNLVQLKSHALRQLQLFIVESILLYYKKKHVLVLHVSPDVI